MDTLDHWRSEFPIVSTSTYMISNSLGAMPRGAAAGLAEYAGTWATRGVRAWEEQWWEMPIEIGDKIGAIIGALPSCVSMHENVTTASAVVLSCLAPPSEGRRKIVCTEMDFPSLLHLYRGLEHLGFTLEVVPAEPDLTVGLDRLMAAITNDTALVCMSHVLFRTSYIMNAPAVIERAHEMNAAVLLDIYQSAGIIPVDVQALDVDFAVGGCLKWLCGGPGNGFLYTNPGRLDTVQPRLTGWVADSNPFQFRTHGIHRRTDAMRMMNGTPTIPAYYAAKAGLDIIKEVGIPKIRAKSKLLMARLLELTDMYGFSSPAHRDTERTAGTIAIKVPDAPFVARRLKSLNYLVDYRPSAGIRISPHFYNTIDEIDRLMAEVQRIVRTKDYDSTSPFTSVVS